MPETRRVLLLFLDGVGIGPADPAVNPFLSAALPNLRSLLPAGIPTLDGQAVSSPAGTTSIVLPLDPLMGVAGHPQSGTGHTALLTGRNAAALYGRHFGPWVPVPLRPIMMSENVLIRAVEAGLKATFANAYPRRYMERAWTKRPAGPPLAAQGAGLLERDETHLALGEAVASEILNDLWRTRLEIHDMPLVTPAKAGENLARIAASADLTLFAHYATDTAGHTQSMEGGIAALEKVDAFLSGLLPSLPDDTLLAVASDHGNIEDTSRGHTLNPTFNLLHGPGASTVARGLTAITDLAPALLSFLGVEDRSAD